MQGLVSIIIPTFNRAHYLGVALDSVLAQTYKKIECIVVDDGSSDYTAELLEFYVERDSRVRFYSRPKNMVKGANSCRNYGYELSLGEFINWFDSDDAMMPELLEKQLNNLRKETQFSICSGYFTDEFLNIDRKMSLDGSENLFKDFVLWKNHIITNSILFRKNFLLNKKLFNVDIMRGQEMELFSRLFFNIKQAKYSVINEPLFLYRGHSGSITMANQNYVKSYVRSQSFTALGNLKKGISLDDNEIIKFCYSKLIYYFFRGFENEDRNNSSYIFKNLVPLLWKFNRKLCIEFLLHGLILLGLNRGSYSIERKFRYSL